MMDGHELAEVVGAFGIFAFITTVVTVIIMQVGATVQARAALAREEEYRKLTEAAVAAQQGTERLLTDTARHLAAMEERMSTLERILQTVE